MGSSQLQVTNLMSVWRHLRASEALLHPKKKRSAKEGKEIADEGKERRWGPVFIINAETPHFQMLKGSDRQESDSRERERVTEREGRERRGGRERFFKGYFGKGRESTGEGGERRAGSGFL